MGVGSDLFSFFIAGYIHERLGSRISLLVCYLTSALGGILTLAYGLDHMDSIAFPIFFFLARFGVAGN